MEIILARKLSIWCISKYACCPQYGFGSKLYFIAKQFAQMGNDVVLIRSDSHHGTNYPKSRHIYNFDSENSLIKIWIKTIKYINHASILRFISWIDFDCKLFFLNRNKLKKPDVVIVSSLSLTSIVFGLFLKNKYKCKLIFEIRDIQPLILVKVVGLNKNHPIVWFLGKIEKMGYVKADLIVGTMPNLCEHVKNILGYEKECYFSPLGIPDIWENQIPKSNIPIDSLFPGTKKFIVGYAGSIGLDNALDPFINAIRKMTNNQDVHFVIVGSGDLKEKYAAMLKNCSNVTIGPKINREDVPYFLSKCDLLYLSAHDNEVLRYGQSLNKLIDYMMAAKPVLASYSGFPSMLNEAKSGLFIPTMNTEAIIDGLLFFKNINKKERELYGERGKKWIMTNRNYANLAKALLNKINSIS